MSKFLPTSWTRRDGIGTKVDFTGDEFVITRPGIKVKISIDTYSGRRLEEELHSVQDRAFINSRKEN